MGKPHATKKELKNLNKKGDPLAVNEQDLLDGNVRWVGPDYAETPIPDEREKPKDDWTVAERRAFLVDMLKRRGHYQNFPKNQYELGDDFDVSQATISEDFSMIRKYLASITGHTAISDTEVLVDKAVAEMVDNGNFRKAWTTQKEYIELLMDMGVINREPDKKQVQSVNASVDVADLDDDERDMFDSFVDQMRDDEDDEVIDVESKPVENGGETT